jgi:glycosyltransferase involved in cell wall biosynthesis
MKIAIVNDAIYPYYKGGTEKRDWEIAKRLSKKGHKVHIFGMKEWRGKSNFVKDRVYIHGIGKHIGRYTKTGRISMWQVVYFTVAVFFPLLKEKLDVINIGNSPYFLSFSVKIISSIKKTPTIATWDEIWGDYWYDYLGKIGLFGKIIENIAVKFPDKIITVSNATKEQLIRIGVNENNVVVIHNGIDLNDINNVPAEGEIDKRKIDVLFVGRLIKDKNVDVLIKAIKLVKRKIPNVICYIIGDGPEKEKLIEIVEDLDLKENVKLMGFLENYADVIAYMKSSKIFVFPSTREGFGIVIIEANACGLPVIGINSKNSKCVAELIKSGENGFLVNEVDENILAEKIILLREDDNLRIEMSENGRNFSRNYDWNNISAEVERVYEQLLVGKANI